MSSREGARQSSSAEQPASPSQSPKRGRGRPRKPQKEPTAGEPSPKRPRGRPKGSKNKSPSKSAQKIYYSCVELSWIDQLLLLPVVRLRRNMLTNNYPHVK
ncbi:hypothetical protein XENTR_v10008524 [Xenopus tropicalis]|uniref:High mobility group AT-hook 1 n=1 Tax=Xenopus tropicalis TaxID=8364 RepID=A0A6I8R689_XENTR|nr:hypothetical protein XENTR_v10008524 [Xenopus tropicalis]